MLNIKNMYLAWLLIIVVTSTAEAEMALFTHSTNNFFLTCYRTELSRKNKSKEVYLKKPTLKTSMNLP